MASRRRAARIGWFVVLVALGLRCGWIIVDQVRTGVTLDYPDETLHWSLAENLVTRGALVSHDGLYASRMPIYPLFLALFAWLGEAGLLAVRLAQALIGALTAGLVYRLGRRAVGPTVGLVGGLLVAVDPFQIFFSNLLLTEVLFTWIGVGLVYCAWLLLQRQFEVAFTGLIGVVLLGPAAVLTRPSAAGWIVLLWIVLFLVLRKQSLRRVFVLAAPLILALLLLPWGVRNYIVIGDFAWLSTNGGVTLYDAQGPQATGASDQAFRQQMPELAAMGEAERDDYLADQAWGQMRANPGRVLALAGSKFLRTWSLTPNVANYRGGLTAWVSGVFTAIVLAEALFGLFRVWRQPARHQRRLLRLLLLLWLPVIYFTLVHMVYIGSVRYRIPVMPFVALTAAMALAPRQRLAPPTRPMT